MHVINTTLPITVPTDEHLPDRLVWIGKDDRGLELEVVGLVEPDRELRRLSAELDELDELTEVS